MRKHLAKIRLREGPQVVFGACTQISEAEAAIGEEVRLILLAEDSGGRVREDGRRTNCQYEG